MLELTGIGSVLQRMGIVYWLIAISVVAFVIWKGRSWRQRALWAAVAVAVLAILPVKQMIEQYQRNAYAREAWAYFRKLCDEKSGEKIYETHTGVKSVLVVKPLPPATEKDLYDQFWYGDPYSDANPYKRAESAALRLASATAPVADGKHGRGYDFVEMRSDSGSVVVRYMYLPGSRRHGISTSDQPESRFGISWEDISTPEDRKYWVAGSRFRVIDMTDQSIVAERIGYLIESGFGSTSGQRRPWQTARGIGPNGRSCPDAHDWSDRWFLLKVLRPELESPDGK